MVCCEHEKNYIINHYIASHSNMNTFLLIIELFVLISAGNALDDSDVQFYLYSSDHPTTPIQYTKNMTVTSNGLIDPNISIKILCHGYIDNSKAYWIEPTKSAYFSIGKTNVISVDWGKHAFHFYPIVYQMAKPIGEYVAELIMSMSDNLGIPLANFHLIGHSVAVHICGFAGRKVLKTKGKKIGRITALDAALPFLDGNDLRHRISTEDAAFVDAIHTDPIIGFNKPLGHADFWPNGGLVQPGCESQSDCSHRRTPIYFYESIGNNNFPSFECDSIQSFNNKNCFGNKKEIMGDTCDPKARGNFYLNTNKASPFGITSY